MKTIKIFGTPAVGSWKQIKSPEGEIVVIDELSRMTDEQMKMAYKLVSGN